MEDNKVSVVICHHKGDLIQRCFKSLEKINANKIIITSQQTLEPRYTVFYVDKNEPTYKRNLGTKLLTNKYLAFLDDDIEIKYDCISQMEDYLDSHSDVGMVYAMLYKMDNHQIIDTSGSFLTWCGFLYETYINRIDPIPILSGKSALCMVRRDIFEQVGRFDEDFVIYGEETDLSWRIWLAGYKVMVLPSAIGYHAFETALKPRDYYNPYFIHYHGCKNYITMLIKNLPARKLYIAGINAFIWFIIGCCLWFRNKQGAKWIMQGIWYNIINFDYIWRKRKVVKRINQDFYRYICKNPSLFYYFNRFKDYIVHQLHGGIDNK